MYTKKNIRFNLHHKQVHIPKHTHIYTLNRLSMCICGFSIYIMSILYGANRIVWMRPSSYVVYLHLLNFGHLKCGACYLTLGAVGCPVCGLARVPRSSRLVEYNIYGIRFGCDISPCIQTACMLVDDAFVSTVHAWEINFCKK